MITDQPLINTHHRKCPPTRLPQDRLIGGVFKIHYN